MLPLGDLPHAIRHEAPAEPVLNEAASRGAKRPAPTGVGEETGDVAGEISRSVASYIDEVKNGQFPDEQHCYRMKPGEPDKLTQLLRSKKIDLVA